MSLDQAPPNRPIQRPMILSTVFKPVGSFLRGICAARPCILISKGLRARPRTLPHPSSFRPGPLFPRPF